MAEMKHISRVMTQAPDPVIRFALYIAKLSEEEYESVFAGYPDDPSQMTEFVIRYLELNAQEVEKVLSRQ